LNLILTSTFSSNLNDFNRFALGAFQVERVYVIISVFYKINLIV
jgi:hypothetical protein